MILISSCLAGHPVRYDGKGKGNEVFTRLVDDKKALYACPELLGGLSVPRAPAEIIGGDGEDCLEGRARVVTIDGEDVTDAFIEGAKRTLDFCLKHSIETVVLKSGSPSCGSGKIYDGTFTSTQIVGDGVTTALLKRHHITVMDEFTFIERINDTSMKRNML